MTYCRNAKRRHWNVGKDNPRYGNHCNYLLGHKQSEEHKRKLALLKIAEKNPMWRGDNVGNNALHVWIKRYLPKPEKCQKCNQSPPYDLANITGDYNRELKNWEYLCRRCHMISDGRMDKIHEPGIRRSQLVKNIWSKMSKEERYTRIKKAWIKRKENKSG